MNLTTAHNQWAKRPADQRFKTLDELEAAVLNRRTFAKTCNLDIGDMTIKEVAGRDGKPTLAFNGMVMPAEPSHWSFGQVCRAVKAPAEYIRTRPLDIAVRCLNSSIAENGNNPVKLMTLTDPDGKLNTLQAVTGTRYGRVWDADVVGAVKRIVQKTGGRFYNPKAYAAGKFGAEPEPSGLYASDHDVFAFLIDGGSDFDAGPRAQLNRGFIVWNSEVGSRSLGIQTFLFNRCCGNHIIWDATEVNTLLIRHSSGAPSRFDSEAIPHLLTYINASAKPVEDMVKAANRIKVVDLLPAAAQVAKTTDEAFPKVFTVRFGDFNRGEVATAVATAIREEGKCETLWDMVQGFTASARSYEWVDARLDLEARAGKLLEIANN
jgi:hypothetical protein